MPSFDPEPVCSPLNPMLSSGSFWPCLQCSGRPHATFRAAGTAAGGALCTAGHTPLAGAETAARRRAAGQVWHSSRSAAGQDAAVDPGAVILPGLRRRIRDSLLDIAAATAESRSPCTHLASCWCGPSFLAPASTTSLLVSNCTT